MGNARYFIGAATTAYQPETGLPDLPELELELNRARLLFTTLGYAVVPGFGLNMTVAEFAGGVRDFLRDRGRSGDVVVVYYTGHGLPHKGDLLMPMADTGSDISYRSLSAAHLTGPVLDGLAPGEIAGQQVLFILDACYGSEAAATMTAGLIRFHNGLRRSAGAARSAALIVAARDYEAASAGAFTQALADTTTGASADERAVAGHDVPFLPLESLVGAINERTPAHQHATVVFVGEAAGDYFPNPRYVDLGSEFDLHRRALLHHRAARARERRDHVEPRAQGLDAPARHEDLSLFCGRSDALRAINKWIESGDPTAMIVTGGPGSGKSAVLSRIDMLADQHRRQRVPELIFLPTDTIPRPGSIQRFIHARGLTPRELLTAMAEACDVEALATVDSPGQLINRLRQSRKPVIVIVDALDETIGGQDDPDGGASFTVEDVLSPLISAAGRIPLRLLLATRSHLLNVLGRPAHVLDLDAAEYADPGSMRQYARRCLTELVETSPYRGKDDDYLATVAQAVADSAGGSFLVALITARSLALRSEPCEDPEDPRWRATLPSEAAVAMRQDLDLRLGRHADRARGLLLPLAYAQTSGLPWESLWPRLARELTGQSCTNADIDWLIDNAGYYIVETSRDGRSLYRIYHEALTQHLLSDRDTAADHGIILSVLMKRTPRSADGSLDWAAADAYTKTAAALHAAGAQRLDELLLQPAFLLETAVEPLLAALAYAGTADGHAAADAYRLALPRLRSGSAVTRASYLLLFARFARAHRLAEAIVRSRLPLSWSADWASWTQATSQRAFAGHNGIVCAVAIGRVNDRVVTVSGSDDQTLRLWDAMTGNPLGEPITGHLGPIYCAAFARLGQQPIIVSGSDDRTVRIWDATTGEPMSEPLRGHSGWVRSVAVGEFHGRAVIVSGGDQTVRIWDATTGQPIGEPLRGHDDWVRSVCIGTFGDTPVIVSGSDDRTIRIWNATTGQPIGEPLSGHAGPVYAVAFGEVNGDAIIASAADDQTVRLWAAATGTLARTLTGHLGYVCAVDFGQLDGRSVVVSGGDSTVRVWDAATGDPIGVPFTGHTNAVHALAFGSLDRKPAIAAAAGDSVHVWDAATGNLISALDTDDWINAVALVRDEARTYVIAAGNRKLQILDAATGEAVAGPLTGHTDRVNAVAIGSLGDRTLLVSAGDDRTIIRWDAHTGEPIGTPIAAHTSYINAVALGTIDNRTLIVSGGHDGTVRAFDAATGQPAGGVLTGHLGPVFAVVLGNVDGRRVIISGGADKSVRLWNTTPSALTGEPADGHTACVRAVAYASDAGRLMVVSAGEDGDIRRWDPVAGTPLGERIQAHPDWIRSIAVFHREGRTIIASGGDDHVVRLWDATTGRQLLPDLSGPTGRVFSVAVSECAGRLILASAADTTIRRWDAETGTPVGEVIAGHHGRVYAVALGRGRTEGLLGSGGSDGHVRIWHAITGELRLDLDGHANYVNTLAFGEIDGRSVVASGSSDCTIRIWDLSSGDLLCPPLTEHTGPVYAVAFAHRAGRPVLVSGSNDQTVRIVDLASPLSGAPHPASDADVIEVGAAVYGLAVSSTNQVMAATGLGLLSLRFGV